MFLLVIMVYLITFVTIVSASSSSCVVVAKDVIMVVDVAVYNDNDVITCHSL